MADFLFVLLIIILLFGVFRRYIAFMVLNAVAKGMKRNFDKMNNQDLQPEKPIGKVTVEQTDRSGKSKSNHSTDDGEYVDYVEVKD